MPTPERPMFHTMLPARRFSWRKLGPSVVAHLFLVAFALYSPIFLSRLTLPDPDMPVTFVELEKEDLNSLLVPPTPVPTIRPPRPEVQTKQTDALKLIVVPPPEKAPEPKVPLPEVPQVARKIEPPRPEPRKVVAAGFDRSAAAKDRPATREVKTSLFAEGSSAPPTLKASPARVQTGGFGDPDGKDAPERTTTHMALAQVGSFDLPAGPGHGNGTGGSQGMRGTVASAGFGSGVATERAGGDGGGGTVRSAGFADTTAPAAPVPRARPAVAQAALIPAEIVSKPKPAYTDEARSRRIEGDVVLEVLFSAAGESRVLRVVKGLGSGLDEEAVHAAERIVFKPARRDGQPVDFTATVRITFNLA